MTVFILHFNGKENLIQGRHLFNRDCFSVHLFSATAAHGNGKTGCGSGLEFLYRDHGTVLGRPGSDKRCLYAMNRDLSGRGIVEIIGDIYFQIIAAGFQQSEKL